MFKKYDAYKDSGVEWLGEIPKEWSIKPGLVAFSENKRSNKGMVRNTVLSLSYGKIIIKPEEKLVGLVPESFETYQLYQYEVYAIGDDIQVHVSCVSIRPHLETSCL